MQEFIKNFTGLERNYGFCNISNGYEDPDTGKIRFKNGDYGWSGKPITQFDYKQHLDGTKSIGIQPCNDSDLARFGAIDIDPKIYKNLDVKYYLDIIQEKQLPLIPVKSKSGGLHLYLFTKELVRAKVIKDFLEDVLFLFKLPINTEIFPKKTKLGSDTKGNKVNGNFINLPYFGKKERVALDPSGKEIPFDVFLQCVELNKVDSNQIKKLSDNLIQKALTGGPEEFKDGPPCLAILSKNKMTDGRDRFLYNYMVFAKKKYSDDWEKMVVAAPGKYFEPGANGVIDWTETKTKQKLKSWARETKGHTCNEDPIQPVCMKAECRKRTYGYLSDKKRIFPALSGLQKITYAEPQYTFNVTLSDGQTTKEVRAKNIKQIIELGNIRAIIGAAADMIPPKIKQN